MQSKPSLAVSASDQYKDRSLSLAKQLSLPLCCTPPNNTTDEDCTSFNFVLHFKENKTGSLPVLSLTDPNGKLGGSIYVDFVGGKMGHRRQYGGGRGQPLARAIGLKGGINPGVVDATVGLLKRGELVFH